MDYEAEVTWDNEEDEPADPGKGVKLVKVAGLPLQSPTKPGDNFGTSMEPQTQSQLHGCPSMDKVIKGRLSAATKSQDRQLARQQALSLDAVGPVTCLRRPPKASSPRKEQ